jgi:hypothetical protein
MGMNDGGIPARHHVRQTPPRSKGPPRVHTAKSGQWKPLDGLRPIRRLAREIRAGGDGQIASGFPPCVSDAAKERVKARATWHDEQYALIDFAHAHNRLRW